MSTRKTKRHSGAFYKKERERKKDEKAKMVGSLEKFLHPTKNLHLHQITANEEILEFEPQPSTSGSSVLVPVNVQSGVSVSENNSDSDINSNSSDIDDSDSFCDSENLLGPDKSIISQSKCDEVPDALDFNDPGTWPHIITNKILDMLVENGPTQLNSNYKFPCDDTGRKFSFTYYYKSLVNGEKIKRVWLCYSIKLNSVFCFPCKLFGKDPTLAIVNSGYSDWRHCSEYLTRHENSLQHIRATERWCELKVRLQKNVTIDKDIQMFYNREKNRWRAIIERMIAIIQFLAGQNLAFRGSSSELYERDNGNFLKAVEMLAKFDSVISEHVNNIIKSKDLKNRMPHYLGNVFQNEIIQLLGEAIKKHIITIIKKARYFSIIVDSTPDVSHVEQITFVVRCVKILEKEAEIQEFFLGFFPVVNTTGEGLCNFLLEDILPSLDLDVQDIRGQGYDNGANMRGKNIGLQKRLLDINPRAMYVPCAAHTLNLVVNDAASSSGEIAAFFDLVQEIYTFFSGSTYRWDVFKKYVKTLSLKPLSDTRWESRINAIRPLQQNLKEILIALDELAEDPTRDLKTKNFIKSLTKKIKSFKFICSIIIWHDLLLQINIVSKMLQNPKCNMAECVKALEKLQDFLHSKRNEESFSQFITLAVFLAKELGIDSNFEETRKRKKPRLFDYESHDELLEPTQKFKKDFYFTLLDYSLTSVSERFDLLRECSLLFSFLYEFNAMNDESLKKACMDLDIKMTIVEKEKTIKDLDGIQLFNEIKSYKNIFTDQLQQRMSPVDILNNIISKNLISCFPNFALSLRIFLTLPVSVATGERSFSKLKLIKNYLRSNMSQDRLSSLAIISIESNISESLDLSKLIDEFAMKKSRKAIL